MNLASLGGGLPAAFAGAVLLFAACGRGDTVSLGAPPAGAPALVASAAPSEATAHVHPLRVMADEGDAAPPVARALPLSVAAVGTPAASRPEAPPDPRTTAAPRAGGVGAAAARVVDRGSAERRFVALSFDAGADAGYTTQILDTLRTEGVTVSFGITGRWSEQNPGLLRRIVADGHHLINHTYDHGSFTGFSTSSAPLSAEARHRQLDRTAEVVRSIAGVEFGPYFRPPYGDYDASVNTDIAARGYTWNVMWTVDSLGWNGLGAAAIVDRCLARATPGAIYIFHVGSQSQDALALPAIIEGLRRQGYALGSAAALLEG